jgi:hypothetical protein
MNETLKETLDRLAKEIADYRKFVAGTRSQQLAIDGVRDSALLVARAELALREHH